MDLIGAGYFDAGGCCNTRILRPGRRAAILAG